MRKILIPVAAVAALALSTAAFAQTGGASGAGATTKSGSDATAPMGDATKDGMAPAEKKMKKKKTK
jgi:hypothetical protein